MKIITKIVILAFAILPSVVSAESGNLTTSEPSAHWPDGYINWRGKLVRPSWQIATAGDGSKFAIDLSTRRPGYIAAYAVGGETFDRSRLFELHGDCNAKAFEIVTAMEGSKRDLILKQLSQLVCSGAASIP
jgi:hypothetical protein